MMDPEDLQSDLLALRRLYRLLVQDEHYIEDAASENLDDNARRLLIKILDAAANKAFDAHAKILDAQFRATNSLWSTPQGQSRDGLSLRSFSMRKAPTDAAYVDLLTGDWNFSESTDQADLAGDPGTRMKRCRACRKTKVKQLTKEISFRDSKALTPINGQFLINLTDQEDQISREASTKILQLESCISSLQVAAKHTNFLKNEPENEPKQTGIVSVSRSDPNSSTSQMIWKPIDTGQQCDDQTTRLINELALQGPLVNTTLPSSQTVSQQVEEPVVNKIETFNRITNQCDYIPEEAYSLFPSSGKLILNKMADKNRFLHRSLSSQINRQPLDQLQMGRKEAMRTSEMTEWRDPVEFVERKQPGETYNDQMDRYRGKHEVVDPKILVSAATQRLSESPVSSSNNATQNQSPSQSQNLSESPSQSYNSFSVSEKTESEMNTVSSQDESPYKSSSFESLGSMSRRTVPKRGYKEVGPKEPNRISESKMKMDSSRDLFPYMSSGSDESSRARWTVPEKGNKKGDQEEPKRKSESKMNTVSSQVQSPYMSSRSNESSGWSGSGSGSGSGSRRTVPKKGHQKGNKKEPNMNMVLSLDQSSYTSSGSIESSGSGSGSRRKVPRKGHKNMDSVSSLDQNSYTGSSSNESSRSGSRSGSWSGSGSGSWSGSGSGSGSGSRSGSGSIIPKKGHQKGNQKESKRISESKISPVSSMDQSSYTGNSSSSTEPEESQVGRLGKLKDKLAVIFHHHHHHHHHHHGSSEEEDYKKVLWRNAKKVIGQGGKAVKKIEKNALPAIKKYEAHGEVMVKKMEKKALPAIKKYAAHGEHAVKKIEKKALPAIKKYASHGEHAVKKIEKKALPAIKKYASHGEHAVKKIYKKAHGKHAVKKNDHNALAIKDEAHSEHTIKKNENKALVLMKDEAHGDHAVKKNENKALVLMKDEAHGEHALKKNESNALVLMTDYGEHTVKKNENKALVLMKNDAHGEHTVKKNENKALVLMKNEGHGEHAVKKIENKALVIKKDAAHGEHVVKKSDNMALVLHKAGGDKDSKALVLHKPGGNKESKALVVRKPGGKKQTSQMQALMGGLLKNSRRPIKSSKSKSVENTGGKKQTSQMQALMGGLLKNSCRSTKTSKSKSSEKRTPSGSSGQKNVGGVKTGQKMQWFQMLRQQRKVERLEKLRKKVDYGKVAATLKRP